MNKNKIDIDTLHGFGIITKFPKFLMYYIKNFVEFSFLNAFPDLHEKFYWFQQAFFQKLKFWTWKLKFFLWNLVSFFKILHFKPLIYINFESSIKVLTSLILYQNFCSPKNIRMFLRTVREPSEFGRALCISPSIILLEHD